MSKLGKDFESKYSTGEQEGSHRKIVSYEFGRLRILLRFEVDCVVEGEQDNPMNSLLASMAEVKLSSGKAQKFEDSTLSCIKYGEFRRDEKSVELTSKSTFKNTREFPDSKWNQLFFSNTDYLLIGWHSRGMLVDIEKLTFPQVTRRCGRSPQAIRNSMAKLHDLLIRLKSLMTEEKDNVVFSVIFHKEDSFDSIKIYKCLPHAGCLPKKFANIF